MADIHIHRSHGLGLAKARKMAWKWAEDVEEKFDMECTVIEGDDHDVVEFRRAGVDGRLRVEADAFDLTPGSASCSAPSAAGSSRRSRRSSTSCCRRRHPPGARTPRETGRTAPRRSAAKTAPQGASRPRRR